MPSCGLGVSGCGFRVDAARFLEGCAQFYTNRIRAYISAKWIARRLSGCGHVSFGTNGQITAIAFDAIKQSYEIYTLFGRTSP